MSPPNFPKIQLKPPQQPQPAQEAPKPAKPVADSRACRICGKGALPSNRVHFARVTDQKPCPGSWPETKKNAPQPAQPAPEAPKGESPQAGPADSKTPA